MELKHNRESQVRELPLGASRRAMGGMEVRACEHEGASGRKRKKGFRRKSECEKEMNKNREEKESQKALWSFHFFCLP